MDSKALIFSPVNATTFSDKVCMVHQRTWSYGFYNDKHSLYYSLPLLLFQNILFSVITGLVRLILMPLQQPMIVSEIIAGIIIGPSVLGANKQFNDLMFPVRGQVLADTLATMAVIYYIFVEGLKQDLHCVTHAGKKEIVIAFTGITSAFLACTLFVFAMKGFLPERVQRMGFLGFMPGACAMSLFPVVQPILAELGLLNSELGRLAMTLSMINSTFATLLSLANQTLRNGQKSTKSGLFTFTCSCTMYLFFYAVARPATLWVIRKVPDVSKVDSGTVILYMVLTLVGAAVSDLIGSTMFQAPLIFGILIPPGPPLGSVLVQKIETFLRFFLLPYFFVLNGRAFSVFEVDDVFSWWFMVLAFYCACFGKFMGTLLTAKYYDIPNQASVTLAFIMCFKGIMELVFFTTWSHFGLIDGPRVAAVELATISVIAIATPLVRKLARRSTMPLFAYQGRSMEGSKRSGEFNLLMCVHEEDNVPTLLNLLNASNGTKASPINLCLLHLVELAGRGAPILTAYKNSGNSLHHSKLGHIIRAFENLEKQSHVLLDPYISISPYKTMHQDVCALATEKSVSMVVVPLHKQIISATTERTGQMVARNILYEAPCSVGVLLDRSDLRRHVPKWTETGQFSFRVGTVFLGGADDREALCYVSRMGENPNVRLLVLRCITPYAGLDHDRERVMDEDSMEEFRLKTLQQDDVVYREENVVNVEEMMDSIRSMGTGFDMMIVGRRHPAHSLIVDALSDWSECVELGVIGDFLASSDFAKGGASVLSIQQNRMISCLGEQNYRWRQTQLFFYCHSPTPLPRSFFYHSDAKTSIHRKGPHTPAMELHTTIHQQINYTYISQDACLDPQRIWSFGFYNHQLSLQYSLPLLLFQIIMFTFIMGFLRLILRPFKQPSVISEIMAGVIIGPTLLGSFEGFDRLMFPIRGQVLSDSLASLGLIFYLFVEGLKQDISSVVNVRSKEIIIFLSGIVSSYVFCGVFIFTMQGFLPEKTQALGLLRFLPTALSISNFTNIQPILAELGLMNTELGRLSMTLAMLNGAFGTILSLVFQSIRHSHIGLRFAIYTFISGSAMYGFLYLVARPVALWIIRRTPDGSKVDSGIVLAFLVFILVAAAVSDAIGTTMFHAPLVLGILIPPGPPLGSVLVEKIETMNRFFLLPHFFVFNGRKFSMVDVPDESSWWFMQLAVFSGCLGKFMGTMSTAMYFEIPYLESVTLSIIMCFKGVMELVVYTNWMRSKAIDGPTLASLEFGTIMITAITAALVGNLARKSTRPLFNYSGRSIQSRASGEFRLMMCIFDEDNIVPALLDLLNATSSTKESPISNFLLHLVELQGRGAPILTPYKSPMAEALHHNKVDHIIRAFENLVKQSGAHVTLNPFTSVSPCKTMHQDVCTLATQKKVCLVIVPLPKVTIYSEASAAHERAGRMVARNILYEAPCTVGVLLDRNNMRTHVISRCNSNTSVEQFSFRVGTVFLGGGDDREALCFVSRLVESPNVSLLALRCLAPYGGIDPERERELDDELIKEFRIKSLHEEGIIYREETVINVAEMMNSIRSMGSDFDLMIVGRRHPAHSLILDALSDWSECVELGVIGDFLASSDFANGGASVLSIQQNSMISGLVML
ncbi:hypothetical protein H6P81_017039 [Aristolochia fimbriata]|uniref:Cation/H+ exchanger domain-containing protein n=1 Tax=Aristolochia fimbriata TaxID=158543 RepID=A0AAV7DWZ7_ARIFI|nr:hypothetical protein H6P81_017039 [Aristolochia fimbriata]